MGGSSLSLEATKWLIRIQTSRSVDELWPDFEAWLYRDQAHWDAFVQAQEMWFGLDWLKELGSRPDSVFAHRLHDLVKEGRSRSGVGFILMAIGMSAVMWLLAFS